jgi:hypothetical protein
MHRAGGGGHVQADRVVTGDDLAGLSVAGRGAGASFAHGEELAVHVHLGPHQGAAEEAVVRGAHHGDDLLGVLRPIDQALGGELRVSGEVTARREVLGGSGLAAFGDLVDQLAQACDGRVVAPQAQRQGGVVGLDRHRDALEHVAAIDQLPHLMPRDGVFTRAFGDGP